MVWRWGVTSMLAGLLAFTIPGGRLWAGQARGVGRAPGVAFHRQDGRQLVTLDPGLLDTDVRIGVRVMAVARTSGSAGIPGIRAEAGPARGDRLASGALRLCLVEDSLVLSEYVGVVRGQRRYRRRAATPVRLVRSGGEVTVDAAPLWAVLVPERATAGSARRLPGQLFSGAVAVPGLGAEEPSPEEPSPEEPSPEEPSPEEAVAVRQVGPYAVTYAVDVFRLPAIPMRPRFSDARLTWSSQEAPALRGRGSVGSDSVRRGEKDAEEDSVPPAPRRYIRRFRLDLRQPSAPVSDVVQPIAVRISDSIPKPWVPYFVEAVESWNAVFESIGFRRAIRIFLPGDPPPADSLSQVVLRWDERRTSSIGGKSEYERSDPRTGEILRTRIDIYGNVLHWVEGMYFAGVGARDLALVPPMPPAVSGALLRFVVAHEFGHTLGFEHNFQIDGYPTDSLRRPGFVRRMGFAPSVMAYSFINFVAQPEDSMPFDAIVLRPGPYDRWALGWGYRPIPEAATPEAELPVLERWRTPQDTLPYLQASEYTGNDPYAQAGMLGDDLPASVGYGTRNIGRVAEAAAPRLTADARWELVSYWKRLLQHVPMAIGGVVRRPPYGGGAGRQPADSASQLHALRFLLAHAFYGQDAFVRQVLPSPPADSAIVLFDALRPEWASQEPRDDGDDDEDDRQRLRAVQRELLSAVVDERLGKAADQEQERPGMLAALCGEVAAFGLRLSASASAADVSPEAQEYATELLDIISAADPGGGVC